MSDNEKSPVGIPCLGYETMAKLWDLIHDLLGGTQKMQEASYKWLPKESRESNGSYTVRLGRSILFNGFRDTLNKLTNKPFTHPIIVTDLPEEIAYLKDDVDGNNKPLETFIKEVLENLIKYGVAHILVDQSKVEGTENGQGLTKADEKRLGIRVYLINISPASLIGWQSEKVDGVNKLSQIRFKETIVEPEGDYGDQEVNYVNVYNIGTFEIHKQDPEKPEIYNKVKDGSYSMDQIPLITIHANKTGFMTAEPSLIDLAWQNLAHWQSTSDQKNILRFSRFGLIFGKGLPSEMVEAGTLDVGPTKAFLVESENADMKYVEHSGKAIEAGQKDIEDIEQKMRVLGNQPLMREIPNTATAERIDEGRTVSQLQSWIGALERGIQQILKLACKWRDIQLSEDFNINIYSDFEALVLGSSDKELLLKMRTSPSGPEITRERFLKEQQRRGVFSLDMDVEDEAKAVETEEADDLKNFLPEGEEEELEGIEEEE